MLNYKAAVETGGASSMVPGGGEDTRSRGFKDDIKGKGIAREMQGPYRQQGCSQGYKERHGGGYGEGYHHRQYGYGAPRKDQRRYAINTRGVQQLRDGEGDNLSHPQKLMMDAFKGVNHVPKASQEKRNKEGSSGTRKSLLFEESAVVLGLEEEPKAKDGSAAVEMIIDVEKEPKGVMEEAKGAGAEVEDQNSALGDANLMVEGVLLSDSELLDEEWEEGEVPEYMEEMEEVPPAFEVVVQDDSMMAINENGGEEEVGAKAPKKK